MYTDVPLLKRCCFCIPLRYGLIAWGYMGVVACLIFMAQTAWFHVYDSEEEAKDNPWLVYRLAVAYISQILNLVFAIILVVAGYMKNVKLLNMCIYACIVGAVLETPLILITDFYLLRYLIQNIELYWEYSLMYCSILVTFILVKIYLVILLRSEIRKLKTNGFVKFVSLTEAEANCTMITCAQETDIQNVHYVVKVGTKD